MKAPFTFAVVCYNNAEYILDCLESIKYQVEKYGADRDIFLVVSDDHSSDNSVKLIESWCDFNKSLFKDINIIQSPDNMGVSHNFCQALSNIHTELMKTTDGDDYFSSVDVISEIENLKDTEMGIFLPIRFRDKNKSAYIDNSEISEFFYYAKNFKHNHKSDFKLISTIKPFITPEASTRISYYTKDCLGFVQNYKQFEDDPSIYHIFENSKDMVLKYVMRPLICYRVHDKSLSNGVVGNSIHQINFFFDLHSYVKHCFKNEKNFLTKWILFWKMKDTFLQKHFFGRGNSWFVRYLIKKKNHAIAKAKMQNNYENDMSLIEEFVNAENQHYKYLCKCVSVFVENNS